MGNNAAFEDFEYHVITFYDQRLLSLSVLDILAEPYRDTDIDHGGRQDLKTQDGKSLEEVIVLPSWYRRRF